MTQISLLIDPEKCTGCGTCEFVCSLKHVLECNPERSMIRALKFDRMGSYYVAIPVVCQQCERPVCMDVCPVNAINQNPKTGAYVVNADACIGCKLCVIACPLGGIVVDSEKKIAMKCDLCDGDPLCAQFCLPRAIISMKKEKGMLAKKREAVQKLSELLNLLTGTEFSGG